MKNGNTSYRFDADISSLEIDIKTQTEERITRSHVKMIAIHRTFFVWVCILSIFCILLGLGISTLFISVVAGIRLCLNKRNATKFSSTFDDIYCSSASLADVTYNQRKLRGFTGDLADERMLQNVKHMLNER